MINLFVSLSKRRGRWKFLLAAAIATAALGLWGMRLAPDGRTFLDDLYQLRDLFGLGFSLELGNANWQLQVARWLGPLVAAASLLEGIAALSRRRSDAWPRPPPQRPLRRARAGRPRIAHRRRAGRGRPRRGGGRGRPVQRGVGSAAAPRRPGRRGRRTDPPPARAGRAGRRRPTVVVVCGTDATNAEVVASHLERQRAPGAGPLRAAVHLSDAGLCALMRHQSLRTAAGGVRFDFFDVYSAGARLLLSHHPLADAAGTRADAPGDRRRRPVRPLPAGGRGARGAATATTTITIIDRDAEARLQAILLAQPGLAQQARIDAVDVDLDRPGRDAAGAAARGAGQGVTTVAVCFDDDARAVTTALLIRRLLGNAPTEVIARTSGTRRAVAAARRGSDGSRRDRRSRCSSAPARARSSRAARTSRWRAPPRRLHRPRRRHALRHAVGRAAAGGAGVEPAPGRLRSPAGLAAIGCDLVPLGGWGVSHVELTPDEVEVLARREHERWFAERAGGRVALRAGARQRAAPEPAAGGVGRAAGGRRQENGREAARRIPAVLALAGLEVLRLDAVPVSPAAGWMIPTRRSNGSRMNAEPADALGVERRHLDAAAELVGLLARGVGVGDREVDAPVRAHLAGAHRVELRSGRRA